MLHRMFSTTAWFAALSLSAVFLPTGTAHAQATDLSENQSYIRGCRQIKQGVSAIVYDNTDLANKPDNQIGTIFAGTEVALTGVLRETDTYTAAQVYLNDGDLTTTQPVGWIDAAQLTPCPGTTPPPTANVCFRPRTTLVVRSGPSITSANTGMTFTTSSLITPHTQPPEFRTDPADGRVWLHVNTYRGPNWVASTGPNGGGSNLNTEPCR
ncbi:hypothetical protein [Halomicronema sp. CCY15110]|uniref:hypothetical protein n=1 Tax=Halomicronema sp. CCY15110 TaxID=2767773 RepID=UPI00194E9D25|nr:hypothetical protein [Halomicronema sp. CCY15110]